MKRKSTKLVKPEVHELKAAYIIPKEEGDKMVDSLRPASASGLYTDPAGKHRDRPHRRRSGQVPPQHPEGVGRAGIHRRVGTEMELPNHHPCGLPGGTRIHGSRRWAAPNTMRRGMMATE